MFYSVRDVVKSENGIGVLLNEIRNPNNGWTVRNKMEFRFEPNFAMRRFTDVHGDSLTSESIREGVRDKKRANLNTD